jgi:hypothetical protein
MERILTRNREGIRTCSFVPDEVKYLYIKIVAEYDDLSEKRQLITIE